MPASPPRIDGRSTRAWIAALALGLGVVPAGLVPGGASGAPQEIVARVDGEPVTRAELERMAGNPRTLEQARQELGAERPGPADLRRIALRNVVQRRLLIQEARRRNIRITEGELDREIASLRRRFDDLQSFGGWMKEQGLDEGSLFDVVREDMAADRVRTALIEAARVSDDAVRRHYAAHQAELAPGEVRLQIIAVRDEGEAKAAVAALRRGEDFGRVARQRSSGILARQGGDTGWVRADALASPLREAVAILAPGESRGPLRRGSDFLVIRMNERRRGAAPPLAEVRPEIERRLLAEKRRSAVETWLAERLAESKIELLDAASATGLGGEAAAAASSRRR
jgi:parvulin-like peptidyl-prolyl isomerase